MSSGLISYLKKNTFLNYTVYFEFVDGLYFFPRLQFHAFLLLQNKSTFGETSVIIMFVGKKMLEAS
jgi:hypothetical protein